MVSVVKSGHCKCLVYDYVSSILTCGTKLNCMSDSRKKPIVKDKKSKTYWRQIRSRQKQVIRQFKPTTETLKATYSEEQEDWIPEITEGYIFNYEDLEIPKQKEIVNDYDYCDYTKDNRFFNPTKKNRSPYFNHQDLEVYLENKEKFKRK